MDVLTNLNMVINSQYIYIYQIIKLYTLNLHNIIITYISEKLKKKIQIPRPYPRPSKSESLEVGPRYQYFFKVHR